MNTHGHIDAAITYPTAVFNPSCVNGRCLQTEWVKDFNNLNHSQSTLINKIARENSAWGKNDVCEHDAGYDSCTPDCKSASYHIGGKNMYAKCTPKN